MTVFLTFYDEKFLEAFATEELAQRFVECMSEQDEQDRGDYYYFATEVLEK